MIRKLNQLSVYTLYDDARPFTVVLEQLQNTPSGCPRFKAIIIYDTGYNVVYVFRGHYMNPKQEALFILKEHLNKQD